MGLFEDETSILTEALLSQSQHSTASIETDDDSDTSLADEDDNAKKADCPNLIVTATVLFVGISVAASAVAVAIVQSIAVAIAAGVCMINSPSVVVRQYYISQGTGK